MLFVFTFLYFRTYFINLAYISICVFLFLFRKRIAARKLIERYYFQLTDGCGNQSCRNENCASCQRAPKLDPDEAAARAIQLFKSKAKLCVPPCPEIDHSEESYRLNMPNGTSDIARNMTQTENLQNSSKGISEQKNASDTELCKMDTDPSEISQLNKKTLTLSSPTENLSCKNASSNSYVPMDTSKETSSPGKKKCYLLSKISCEIFVNFF